MHTRKTQFSNIIQLIACNWKEENVEYDACNNPCFIKNDLSTLCSGVTSNIGNPFWKNEPKI